MGEWLYFPTADPATPSATLLIAPDIGGKSAVLTIDLAVRSLPREKVAELEAAPGAPAVRIPAGAP